MTMGLLDKLLKSNPAIENISIKRLAPKCKE